MRPFKGLAERLKPQMRRITTHIVLESIPFINTKNCYGREVANKNIAMIATRFLKVIPLLI